MKTKIMTLSAFIAALAASPVLAQSNTAPDQPPVEQGWHKGEHKDGKKWHKGDKEGKPDFLRLFATVDENGDGKVTAEEISAGSDEIVKTFDRNGDGAISDEDMGPPRDRGPGKPDIERLPKDPVEPVTIPELPDDVPPTN